MSNVEHPCDLCGRTLLSGEHGPGLCSAPFERPRWFKLTGAPSLDTGLLPPGLDVELVPPHAYDERPVMPGRCWVCNGVPGGYQHPEAAPREPGKPRLAWKRAPGALGLEKGEPDPPMWVAKAGSMSAVVTEAPPGKFMAQGVRVFPSLEAAQLFAEEDLAAQLAKLRAVVEAGLLALAGPEGLRVDREGLGRLVHEVWIAWAREQPSPKPSWLLSWEALQEPEREVGRRIGEAVARRAGARRYAPRSPGAEQAWREVAEGLERERALHGEREAEPQGPRGPSEPAAPPLAPLAERRRAAKARLESLQEERGELRARVESYAGGDRPPSPPAQLLRELGRSEEGVREAEEAYAALCEQERPPAP